MPVSGWYFDVNHNIIITPVDLVRLLQLERWRITLSSLIVGSLEQEGFQGTLEDWRGTRRLDGNSLNKLRHTRSVAYLVELVLLDEHQISGGGAYLDCYQFEFCWQSVPCWGGGATKNTLSPNFRLVVRFLKFFFLCKRTLHYVLRLFITKSVWLRPYPTERGC